MVLIWRALVWIVGSLSLAALLGPVYGVRLTPILHNVVAAYDHLATAMLAPIGSWVTMLVTPIHDTIGGGQHLLPHWPHVLVVVLLHLLPSIDATYGVGGWTAGALWCAQAIAALLLTLPIAAYVGAAPFLKTGSQEGFFVGALMSAALAVSWIALYSGSDEPGDEAEAARLEERQRWSEWNTMVLGVGMATGLTVILILMLGLLLKLIDESAAYNLAFGVGMVLLVAGGIVGIYRMLFEPDDEPEFSSATAVVSTISMGIGLMLVADSVSPQFTGYPLLYLWLFIAGIPIAGGYYLIRKKLGELTGRPTAVAESGTPALGMFILGSVAIVFLDLFASRV